MENKEYKLASDDLVSIVMPNFNRGEFIVDQLNSLIKQTYKNWELIIVDDCSTDDSDNIIQNFIENHRDRKITFIKNEKNLGVAKNFEKGLQFASGKYIAVCDSDDVWFVDKLEKKLQFLKKGNYGMVYSDLVVVDKNLKLIKKSFIKKFLSPFSNQKDDSFDELMKDNHITAPTILFDAKMKNRLIPFSTYSMQDYWIALIFSMFSSIGYFNEQTMYYRRHSDNVSGTNNFSLFNIIFHRDRAFLEKHIVLKNNSSLFFKDLSRVEGLNEKNLEKINKKICKLQILIESLLKVKKKENNFWKCLFRLWKLNAFREIFQLAYFSIF